MTPAARDPWTLYRTLVAGVPDGVHVVDAVVNHWAVVTTDAGTAGIAMSYEGGPRADADAWRVRGRPLREVAAYALSWDLRLASLGVAALNAWYADRTRLAALPGIEWGDDTQYFGRFADRIGAVPTVLVGHFPGVESLRGDVTVLERNPRDADLPDAAAEYVLPGCRLAAITGSTLVNKTLPRLLELAAGADVHLVGPSAPPVPGVYPGVTVFAGSVVVDPDACLHHAGLGMRGLLGTDAVEPFLLTVDPA